MSDDLPFSRYSEPYLNPFPEPRPEEPRSREEREAEKKEEFTPPFVPYSGGKGEKKSPELSESSESQQSAEIPSVPIIVPQAKEEFDEEFNRDVFKLGVKIVIFTALVIVVGFLFWFLMKDKEPAQIIPGENVGAEIGESSNLISASKGGQIFYKDKDGQILEIVIPEEALEKDTFISVMQISKGAVTNRYQFAPKGLKFLKPVIVKIPYKEKGLKTGETPYDIKLEYQSAPGAQKYLLWYEVDEEAKKLVTQVMGF